MRHFSKQGLRSLKRSQDRDQASKCQSYARAQQGFSRAFKRAFTSFTLTT